MSSACCQSKTEPLASSCCSQSHETTPTPHSGCGCSGHDESHAHAHHHHDHSDVSEGCGCGCGHDQGTGAANESILSIGLKTTAGKLALGYGAVLVLAYGLMAVLPGEVHWPLIAAMGIGLLPLLRQAWVSLKEGNPFSIQLLMIIAATAATVVGAESEAAMVILLFLIGEVLETVAARRAQLGIQKLVDLVPQDANRERNGVLETVRVEALQIGDVVRVGAGQRIPADGIVISGMTAVDESPLTGESVPKTKMADDAVFAGSVNGEGELRVQVNKDASDNAIARVARLVQEARVRRAPVQRFITRFAKYYTPMIAVMAVLVAVLPPMVAGASWSEWVYRAAALLLISCPCALVISTPASLASALSAGAGSGLLLKGGDVLETLAHVDTVAFDKTGTLTEGKPHVEQVMSVATMSERDLMALAAGVSVASRHPVAMAVLAYAQVQGIQLADVTDVTAVPGRGVRALWQGQEVIFGAVQVDHDAVQRLQSDGHIVSELSVDGVCQGYIASRDTVRSEAEAGVRALHNMGLQTLMLTGDSQSNAERVAKDLGVACHAALLPEDKMTRVQILQGQGKRVVKVGDGINDAPALAQASVGIAFGGGTDVALETADAASLNNRVTDVANMVWLARQTMRNIRQNIIIALGLKGVFLVTTIAGVTGLWPAILADTGATVLVTANALRLLRHKPLV